MAFFTRYHFKSDLDLYRLFSSQTWQTLDFNSKLAALQELENRVAQMYGNTPRRVTSSLMRDRYTYGGYSHKDDKITINRDLIESGRLICAKDGLVEADLLQDANVQLVDTIFHENYHAYQRDVVDGKIQHPDKREAAIWEMNLKMDENQNLVNYESDGVRYRIQSAERTAFREGEYGAKYIFDSLEKEYGPDSGYAAYQRNLEYNTYQKTLEYAQACSGNPYYQEDMDEAMLKQYAEEHNIPYVRQSPGKEDADHVNAMHELSNYMDEHCYSNMDYPEYSQDPEWQQLHQNVYGVIDGLNNNVYVPVQSPEARTDAVNALTDYMNEHGYSSADYPEYSQDPEWQRLNNNLLEADGRQPIHYNNRNENYNLDKSAEEYDDEKIVQYRVNTMDDTAEEQPDEEVVQEQDNTMDASMEEQPDEEAGQEQDNAMDASLDEQVENDNTEDDAFTMDDSLDDAPSCGESNTTADCGSESSEGEDEDNTYAMSM